MSGEGACTVSWGRALQSLTVQEERRIPEVSSASVLSVGPVVSASPSGGLMMLLGALDSSKSVDDLVQHGQTLHMPPTFEDGPVQWTDHVVNTCCASVVLEDEASSSSFGPSQASRCPSLCEDPRR